MGTETAVGISNRIGGPFLDLVNLPFYQLAPFSIYVLGMPKDVVFW